MVTKQRARNNQDKLLRRRRILGEALALWDERTFATLTMAEVADRCGLAKGTLYLYFATKEELLLALLEELLADWFDALDAALADDVPWDAARVAGAIGAVTARRVALTRLLAIGESILEHNIAEERALAYKAFLLRRAAATGATLGRLLPALAPGDGLLALRRVHAIVIGLRAMADPAPVVRAALVRPELAAFRVDFDAELVALVEALLRGMTEDRSRT